MGTLAAQTVEMTWHFYAKVAPTLDSRQHITVATAQALVDWTRSNVLTLIMPEFSRDVVWTGAIFNQTNIRTAAGKVLTFTGGNVVGGVLVGSAPPNVALTMTRYTEHRGRRGRGRVFIPGLATSDITDGIFDQPSINVITPPLNTALTTQFVLAGNGTWMHYVGPGHLLPDLGAPGQIEGQLRGADCTKIRINPITKTNRRRTVGRGI
jgi:hypothetical protein